MGGCPEQRAEPAQETRRREPDLAPEPDEGVWLLAPVAEPDPQITEALPGLGSGPHDHVFTGAGATGVG